MSAGRKLWAVAAAFMVLGMSACGSAGSAPKAVHRDSSSQTSLVLEPGYAGYTFTLLGTQDRSPVVRIDDGLVVLGVRGHQSVHIVAVTPITVPAVGARVAFLEWARLPQGILASQNNLAAGLAAGSGEGNPRWHGSRYHGQLLTSHGFYNLVVVIEAPEGAHRNWSIPALRIAYRVGDLRRVLVVRGSVIGVKNVVGPVPDIATTVSP